MAQIAIPLVVVGALYLMSNDKKEDFSNLVLDEVNIGQVNNDPNADKLRNDVSSTTDFYNNIDTTKLNTNNNGMYTQYQDKYLLQAPKKQSGQNLFQTLAGTEIKYNDINHNNMQIFYNNKSNGASSQNGYDNDIKLDSYSGSGSLTIEKKEIGALFKPVGENNNVFGMQNNSDFIQSRMNESLRHANTKPWAEIKDGAGVAGFNWAMEDRDKWMPKKVDELRTTNNPKSNYSLNYQSPAYQPTSLGNQDTNHLHKLNINKKKPDTYHMNSGVGGMGPANGEAKPMQFSEQMLTDSNREHTSVSYYGVKSAMENQGYVQGKANEPHRTELPTNSFTNLTGNQVYPVDENNHNSYKAYSNSRDTSVGYFGALQGTFMQNVVDPLVKGLKHTKKTNFTCNPNNGNLAGPVKQMVFNPQRPSTTNREMTSEKIGLNHLNIERQDSTGHVVSNPYLPDTQRQSMNQNHLGNARSVLPMGRSYDAEYNQRSFDKPTISRTNIGNLALFNGDMKAAITGKETCNNWNTPVFIPNIAPHAGQQGMNTTLPQKYNAMDDYHHPDMLKAFKSNPFTQPLNSVA